MKAIHINSTGPFFHNNPNGNYQIEDFNILFTILSAITWRKFNGTIKLYTDSVALEYYKTLGICEIWDEIDTKTLDDFPNDINPGIFWAASKIIALKEESAPVIMIDQDLIVWKNIDDILKDEDLVVFHREGLDLDDIYLPYDVLKKRADYKPDPSWNWNIMPCNTALAYFKDNEFLKYYTDCAIDFMKGNNEYALDSVSQMVFAEQRIIAMCAEAKNINIKSCLDDPFQSDNDTFTHLWNGKNLARENDQTRKKICKAAIRMIRKVDPTFEPKSDIMKGIFNYYEGN